MKHPILAAAAALFVITPPLASAATLESSFLNQAVTNYDLDAQGYSDWARWATANATAGIGKTDGEIIDRTLGSTGNARFFDSNHRFVQGSSNKDMVARERTNASLTASFTLQAGTDYSIDIFTRVITIANRNNIRVTATFGAVTDVFVIDRFTQTNQNGAGIYTLDVTGIASSGTLKIELFALMDQQSIDTSSNITVRLGAIGVTAIPGDGPPPSLVISGNQDTPGAYDFEWSSQPGKLYDLLTSSDLASPIADWPVYDDGVTTYENIPSEGGVTTLTAVPSPDPRRFFALREFDAPPPPPLFSSDFEDGNGGFTVVTAGAGSAWEYGEPDAKIENVISIVGGNGGSAKAWGVKLAGPYAGETVTSLRSPPIDLRSLPEGAGARLSYALAIDLAADASLVVRVIEEDTDTVIGGNLQAITAQTTAGWAVVGPFNLPVEAIGAVVRIEWLFSGPTDSAGFLGAYLDDVVVSQH